MQRRELSKILMASAGGAALLANTAKAQTCTQPCYPQNAAEAAHGVIPPDTSYPPGDVRRYGAIGDESHDDGPAIQTAIDVAVGGATVFLPPHMAGKSFKVSAPLVITKPLRFVGSGPRQTKIKAFNLAAGQAVIHVDGTIDPNLEFVDLSNLSLSSNNSNPDLLRVNRASNSSFRDIGLSEGRYGVHITGNRGFTNHYERIICDTTPLYAAIHFEGYTGGGHHTFSGCGFIGGYGLLIATNSAVGGLSLQSCNFEQHANEAIYVGGTVQGLNINGCRFEKSHAANDILIDPIVGREACGLAIHGCYFETDVAQQAIQLGGSGGLVRGFSIAGNFAQDHSAAFVRLNGDGESGSIVGNRVLNVPAITNVTRPGVLIVNNENGTARLGAAWNPPLSTPLYTVLNGVTNRELNVSTANASAIAQVLGTLIADLKSVGIIK